MYGFGDEYPSNPETVRLIDMLAQQYIQDLTTKAMEIADIRGGNLDKDCFIYVIRKDKTKFARATYLLKANKDIKEATNQQEFETLESEAKKKVKETIPVDSST